MGREVSDVNGTASVERPPKGTKHLKTACCPTIPWRHQDTRLASWLPYRKGITYKGKRQTAEKFRLTVCLLSDCYFPNG